MENKDIADFMGWDIKDPMSLPTNIQQPVYDNCWSYKFDRSWDWLIPVIEKIEMLGYTFEKNYQPVDRDWQSLIVKGNDILYQEFHKKSIISSYYVVSKFIENFNNKNNGKNRI
jgi:hypothetical protein